MKRRFTKLPIASIAVVLGSLVIGLSMSPVGAQSQLTNGSVVVRSDNTVYLISGGQRRWVATVQITDEEINAYPEAEPIYAGLVPFGSASAGSASAGSTSTGTTASKTGTTASKTGASGSTIATKTGSTTGSTATKPGSSGTTVATKTRATDEGDVMEGQVQINPGSGADRKDPNDPSLAAASSAADPTGRADPVDSTTCPESHTVKGGVDKKYYDVDRPQYPTAEVEVCFRTGKDARDNGYTEAKKN